MRGGEEPDGWLTRVRWRRRGAWQWPAFALAVVAEALLLHLLPLAGDGTPLAPALLLAGLLNLVVVAAGAPLLGMLLRRRRRDLPAIVARDYAGTALIVAGALAIAALGVAHSGAVGAHDRTLRSLSQSVRDYVGAHAPPVYQSEVDRTDVLQIDAHLYRACVPALGSRRYWCMLVDTSAPAPRVRYDPSGAPNASLGHPLG